MEDETSKPLLYPRPVQDQILVQQDKPGKSPSTLLVMPEGHEEWPTGPLVGVATVLRVGPGRSDPSKPGGRRTMDPAIVPGARILFVRRPCTALVPDHRDYRPPDKFGVAGRDGVCDKDLIMLREDDVAGVLE